MKSNRKRHGRKNKHVVRKINEIRKKKTTKANGERCVQLRVILVFLRCASFSLKFSYQIGEISFWWPQKEIPRPHQFPPYIYSSLTKHTNFSFSLPFFLSFWNHPNQTGLKVVVMCLYLQGPIENGCGLCSRNKIDSLLVGLPSRCYYLSETWHGPML